ncbi:uncharacterized protein V1510DRAFT_415657 [Dipodascopsis tothii]|uniref:uncharacterized protein n=1 Tax=Dipodascopsis tothii TaxID=44089 RepID=UPI0034CD1808
MVRSAKPALNQDGTPRRRRIDKHPRSRSGCITCRARHKRCDQRAPGCMNCEALNLVCEGYNARLRWQEKAIQTAVVRESVYSSLRYINIRTQDFREREEEVQILMNICSEFDVHDNSEESISRQRKVLANITDTAFPMNKAVEPLAAAFRTVDHDYHAFAEPAYGNAFASHPHFDHHADFDQLHDYSPFDSADSTSVTSTSTTPLAADSLGKYQPKFMEATALSTPSLSSSTMDPTPLGTPHSNGWLSEHHQMPNYEMEYTTPTLLRPSVSSASGKDFDYFRLADIPAEQADVLIF